MHQFLGEDRLKEECLSSSRVRKTSARYVTLSDTPTNSCFDLCFNVENESDSDDSMIQMILRAHSVAAPEQGAVSFGGLKFSEAELTEVVSFGCHRSRCI